MNEQGIQTEEFPNTQGEPFIDDSVLNTPAKDPKNISETIPDNSVQNYLNLNKPQQFKPQGDVILDLDGKRVQVDVNDVSTETKSEALSDIYGEGESAEDNNGTSSFLVIIMILIGLFLFVYMTLKRNEHIMRLEQELESIKRKV